MNDYAQHQASFSGGMTGEGIIARFITNWQAKRAVKNLWQLDDHMLNDMGLTREEVAWAITRPLSINAVQALEDCNSKHFRAAKTAY
jgi:uncharacterized protein YjiS (DUF1127 family)